MRFTIRDLLWLTVVVALGVAWWVDRARLNRAWRESVDKSLQEIATRTGQNARIETPDGWTWIYGPSIKEFPSHESPAPPPNPPKN